MSCNCGNSWCYNGSICNYNITNGLCCNTCNSNPCHCHNPCDCLDFVKSNCVYYTGATTSCLAIPTNATLTTIINTIDHAICNLPTPSGFGCSVITGQTGQIVSTPYTITNNNCGGYLISIDGAITGPIAANTAAIAAINIALLSKTDNITTNTPSYLSISATNSHTWNIDFINPSGVNAGILYESYTNSPTINTSWSTLKTYSILAGQLNTNGDTIEGHSRYLINPSGVLSTNYPTVRIQFNGNTLMQEFPISAFNVNVVDFEFKIVRISNTQVDITVSSVVGADNGTFYNIIGTAIKSYVIPITALNLTTTAYSINIDGKSNSAGDISVNILELEYIKKT